jgi:hypothetical protein
MALETDCYDYHVLEKAIEQTAKVPGLYCELGSRKGGSLKRIIDVLVATQNLNRVLVSIDPYGHLPYNGYHQSVLTNMDYENSMRDTFLIDIFSYLKEVNKRISPADLNLVFFNLEDTEFFQRFPDGVPTYNHDKKEVISNYAGIFLDGPHWVENVIEETTFFKDRLSVGGTITYDDIDFYDHKQVEWFLTENNFSLIEKTEKKASYSKN